MSDYIGREALIGKVEKHYCAPCKGQGGDLGADWCRSCVINSVLEKVRGIPAADVVEVVRCKDCKWYSELACGEGELLGSQGWCNEVMARPMPSNGFCSFGERENNG